MNNRDLFIDAMGAVASRHVENHIKRVQPMGIRKYLVYPVSAVIYAAACIAVLAVIPLIVINMPKETPGNVPQKTLPVEITLPVTTENVIETTIEETETSVLDTTSESVTTEETTEPVTETSETTPAPAVIPTETTTPASVPEPEPKPALQISEQVMLSPTSAMRTVNGLEFKVTVTKNGSEINEEEHRKYFDEETVQRLKKYWENHVTVHLSVENKGNETVYGCEYYRAMFPMGAAMYADGQPTSEDPSEYTTYLFVQDFDPYSGYQRAEPNAENITFNPIIPMDSGFTIMPPVYGSLYNGGDATIGKKLEIRATLAVFANPSENMKNGIFTKDDIDDLVFVDIVIPWDRNTVVE